MLSKKMQDTARAIERAKYRLGPNANADQIRGITLVAHAIADDQCTSAERNHFLLACGVPFVL